MKKLLFSALAAICFSGISFAQQDSTKMNQNKTQTQKEQKDKSKKTKDNNKSSKKNKRDKVDSVNSNMDTTSRIESR